MSIAVSRDGGKFLIGFSSK